MNAIRCTNSVKILLYCALIVSLVCFNAIIFFDSPLLDIRYFFFIKLIKSVVCLAILLYWNFVRQSNEAELIDTDFRRWQFAALLIVQAADGALFLTLADLSDGYWISSINLLLSACLLFSFYSSYLLKRVADVIVLSAVGTIFMVMISYSLNGNNNIISLLQLDHYAMLMLLVGGVLMLSMSIIWAQHKMETYSEFEILPIMLG